MSALQVQIAKCVRVCVFIFDLHISAAAAVGLLNCCEHLASTNFRIQSWHDRILFAIPIVLNTLVH